MTWLDALWLGLIQGLTEYLPVSSSGHLEIANTLLGIKGSDNLTFAVLVHAATVCSTLVVLWKEIAALFAGVFRFKWNDETQYVSKIFLSMIPVGIVGIFFKDAVESVFGNGLLLVGIMLVVTALLLTFAHYARPRRKEKISYKDAFVIGLAQACAVLPGLSRSGTTIATGLMLGVKRAGRPFLFPHGDNPYTGRSLSRLDERRFFSGRIGNTRSGDDCRIFGRFYFGLRGMQVDAPAGAER